MKAVSYLRCSGVSQIDGDTWDRQREAIARYAGSHGFEIEREFKEEGVPGKFGEDKRPAFQEMMTAILGNGCRTVIIERMDRLAREYKMQEHLLTYLASKEIQVISAATEEDVTAALMGDPMKRAMVQIQGIFAELEKNLLVAKLRKARQRKKDKEGRCEGKKPYGRNDHEAGILARMREYRAEGATYATIALRLNSQNLQPRHSGKWHAMTVCRILGRAAAMVGVVSLLCGCPRYDKPPTTSEYYPPPPPVITIGDPPTHP